MYLGVQPAGMSLQHVWAWYQWKSEDGIRCSGTGIIDICEPPCICWGLNPPLLEEHAMLFISEPSLRSPYLCFS